MRIILRQKLCAECAERPVEDGRAHAPHEFFQEPEVVQRQESQAEDFARAHEVADIGARIAPARRTAAVLIYRE